MDLWSVKCNLYCLQVHIVSALDLIWPSFKPINLLLKCAEGDAIKLIMHLHPLKTKPFLHKNIYVQYIKVKQRTIFLGQLISEYKNGPLKIYLDKCHPFTEHSAKKKFY